MDQRYRGKVCPYCKTPFREEDDIVLCSACEMPHHKDCWVENKGCTTFGCLGTIQGIGGVEVEIQSSTIYCMHCGTPNPGDALYCSACGNVVDRPLQQTGTMERQHSWQVPVVPSSPAPSGPVTYAAGAPVMPRPRKPPMDRTLAARYVGPDGASYLADFQYMAQTGETTRWNWLLFFTAPYWFLHRKMYVSGVGWMAICLLWIGIQPLLGFLVALCGRVAFGFWGESLYRRHIDRLLMEQGMLRPEDRPVHLQRWGGTAPLLAGFSASIYLIVVILIIRSRMGFGG